MKKYLVLLCLLFNPCYAAEWIELYPKHYFDKKTYAYDTYSNTASGWFKILNSGDFPNIKGSKVWYTLNRVEADCTGRKIRALNVQVYDLKGKHITGVDEPGKYIDVVPDTGSEIDFWVLCGLDDE